MGFQNDVAEREPALAQCPNSVVVSVKSDLRPLAQEDVERGEIGLYRAHQSRPATRANYTHPSSVPSAVPVETGM